MGVGIFSYANKTKSLNLRRAFVTVRLGPDPLVPHRTVFTTKWLVPGLGHHLKPRLSQPVR